MRASARAVDALTLFGEPEGVEAGREGSLSELRASLLDGASWHAPDHYFVLKDFMPYQEARLRAMRDYREDAKGYALKCLRNIACAGQVLLRPLRAGLRGEDLEAVRRKKQFGGRPM